MRHTALSLPALTTALLACSTEAVLLNSERIERTFGSYGIEVLHSDRDIRRSSLYSTHDGEQICRTYAVVQFNQQAPQQLARENAEIDAGGSIGAVLKSHGWSISKQTLHTGSLDVGPAHSDLLQRMRLAGTQQLAMHVYRMTVKKNQQSLGYATITEIHHPDYLDAAALQHNYPVTEQQLSAAQLARLVSLLLEPDYNDLKSPES